MHTCLSVHVGGMISREVGSTVPGILQARILEWVAISFSSKDDLRVRLKAYSSID